MKKKFAIAFCLALVSASILPFIYIEANKYMYKDRVLAFLLEEQHYREEDILDIDGHFGKLPTFYTSVVFVDEPHVTYYYFAHDDIHIGQIEANGIGVDLEEMKRTGELLHMKNVY